MNWYYFFIVVGLIVFILIIGAILIKQKLKEINVLLENSWNILLENLYERIEIIDRFYNIFKKSIDSKYLDNMKVFKEEIKSEKQKDIINAFINMEKELNEVFILLEDKNIKFDKWMRKIENNKVNFNKARMNYNDANLRMINMIKLFPFSIIASLFDYKYMDYFRSED